MPPTPDPSPPRLPTPSAGPKAAPSSSSAYHNTSIADTFFDWWCAMAAGRSPLVVSLIAMTALHQRAHGRSNVLAGLVALSSTPASASGRCVLHVHAPASVFLAGATTSSTTSPWAANADELPYAGLGLPGFFAAATGVVLSDVDAGGCAGQSLSAPSSILYRAMAPIFSPCATSDPPPSLVPVICSSLTGLFVPVAATLHSGAIAPIDVLGLAHMATTPRLSCLLSPAVCASSFMQTRFYRSHS